MISWIRNGLFNEGIDLKIVLITDLKKDFSKKLAAVFAQNDYKVYAMGEEQIKNVTLLPYDPKEAASTLQSDKGTLDIYIDTTDERSSKDNFDVRSGIDEKVIRELFDANVVHPMAMLEAFLPLLEAGEGKRLCYLTSAEASLNETRGTNGYGYKMAKAALHNFLQITRNAFAPKGYTMRVFDPLYSEVVPELSTQAAFNYFTRRRGIEGTDERRDDEGNLVFRDAYGRHHPW
jgi:NADP-dependent 3-hydroxy acid dehydrogenase YdfG